MKKVLLFIFAATFSALLFGCQSVVLIPTTVDYTIPELSDNEKITDITDYDDIITLSNEGVTSSTDFATVSDNQIVIELQGYYYFTGTATDVSIVVNADDSDNVFLIFDNVDLSTDSGSIVDVESAKNVYILLKENSVNELTDTDYDSSAIFSRQDLSIQGYGSLTITSYHHGVDSNDDLKVTYATLSITAKGDGLHANDNIIITDATIDISSKDDGIQAKDRDGEKGNISIENSTIEISASDQGMDATMMLAVVSGTIDITKALGKGLKSDSDVLIIDGEITIKSTDDGIHSSNQVIIEGGTITINTGDDGVHADELLQITGGNVTVSDSYEGLESTVVKIDGGTISLNTDDDGISVSDSSASSYSTFGGISNDSNCLIEITGGTLIINAVGDGIDSNGSINITGGIILVDGPTSSMNGAIDYNGSFTMSGGTLLAIGASGMAETISSSSSQYGILASMTSTYTSDITIVDSNGDVILHYNPEKSYQSIAMSSPEFKRGKTYTIYLGGTYTDGNYVTDNYATGGTLTGGTKYSDFTISSIVTTIGSSYSSGVSPRG